MNNYEKGKQGQDAAEAYLVKLGQKILARNYRCRSGEIDLIVQDGDYVAFVEVKYRSNASFGQPMEAVNYTKQKRITSTALHYIAMKKLSDSDFRFDVVDIIPENGILKITHIPNAFSL